MAKSAAEYQRAYRERKAEQAKLAGDPSDQIADRRFFEYVSDDGNYQEVLNYLEWAGINPDAVPHFDTDDDPEHDPENDGPYRGSIGRAERMVGMLLDAASELAAIINRYKRKEISDQIEEIETSDLSDPDARKQALADIVRLQKMLDQLEKRVRWTLPQWKVTE
ncbi:hypothetical protein [Sinorhizobium meliloti]|uniref:hypothetical protein n=1 Tax=Rhizobium meliloti TaxID=382 RepID=UPI000B49D8C2|nr:hypothetical protein [Sinorhizobium meliloti]ASP68312.1 hypothetical protein CDO29_28080 [Sinorhizobium meliloti]MQX00659.1 hypothetical protein [Sinorhizobium meliloti]RVK54284.1 hypothetical protein CN160_04615 [Sinorhizobium meliloti]